MSPPPDIAPKYREFSTWWRLEPRCRSNDISRGVQAVVADPLWMLARQWQVGELRGEDAGSPVAVEVKYSTQPVECGSFGSSDGAAHEERNDVPLEVRVEAECFQVDWRMRAQVGQQFERLARALLQANEAAKLIEAYRKEYEFVAPAPVPRSEGEPTLDRETRRFVEFMAGRVIDGAKLMDAIAENRLHTVNGVTDAQVRKVVKSLQTWQSAVRYEPSIERTATAWQPESLRYHVELNTDPAGGEPRTQLVAPECRNGDIDWYSFSAKGSLAGKFEQRPIASAHPTRIRVRGTSPRWWEFEDAALDFGNLDVARPDLAKLLLMEFVLVYGDDWFSVPLRVNTGNLVRIHSLNVLTTFGGDGIPIKIPASNGEENINQRWEILSIADDGQPEKPGLESVLLVPPLSGKREESQPLEEIRFFRDEGANMVWGVEHTVLNGLGRAWDGWAAHFERKELEREAEIARNKTKLDALEKRLIAVREDLTVEDLADAARAELEAVRDKLVLEIADHRAKLESLERERAGGTPHVADILRYRLATAVPDHWVPFIPAREPRLPGEAEGVSKPVGLQRAQMLRNTDDEQPVLIDATSRLLGFGEGDPIIWLDEAAVPRSGLRLQLTAQRARGSDGKTYVWLGRKVIAGRGEGSSGLKFDVLTEG